METLWRAHTMARGRRVAKALRLLVDMAAAACQRRLSGKLSRRASQRKHTAPVPKISIPLKLLERFLGADQVPLVVFAN